MFIFYFSFSNWENWFVLSRSTQPQLPQYYCDIYIWDTIRRHWILLTQRNTGLYWVEFILSCHNIIVTYLWHFLKMCFPSCMPNIHIGNELWSFAVRCWPLKRVCGFRFCFFLFPRGICVRKWNVLGSRLSGLSFRDPAQRELFSLFSVGVDDCFSQVVWMGFCLWSLRLQFALWF